jgi:hypothetical protein
VGNPKLPADAADAEIDFAQFLRLIERFGLSLAGLGVLGMIALVGTARSLQNRIGNSFATSAAVDAAPAVNASVPAPQGMRYQYPFSVIPSGIASAEELREAIGSDPEVAAHFADFDITRAQALTLDRDAAFYVSYRLHSGIFWTTEKIVVRRGEIVITDGTNFMRARSGSRLSLVPCLPVSSLEPTASEMNEADLVSDPRR